jgi:hypothetical protein
VDAPTVTLASLRAGQRLRGILPGQPVTLVGVSPLDDALVEIFFRDDSGRTGERTITELDADKLELVTDRGNALPAPAQSSRSLSTSRRARATASTRARCARSRRMRACSSSTRPPASRARSRGVRGRDQKEFARS